MWGNIMAYRFRNNALVAAGVYNLVFGAWAVLRPDDAFVWLGMEPPRYAFLWQCIGMIVGVYGLGYLVAATHPVRHWPIVLVGLLGKIFGPMGFVIAWSQGEIAPTFGLLLLTNDLIWWIPFARVLRRATRAHRRMARWRLARTALPLDEVLQRFPADGDQSLRELSDRQPLLLVMLRHSGCIFCREAVADVAASMDRLRSAGVRPVLVHAGSQEMMQHLASELGVPSDEVTIVRDARGKLYRAVRLGRGDPWQLFGPAVWARGWSAWRAGHRVGALDGDGFLMSGAFLVSHGRVVRGRRSRHAGDRIAYAEVAGCPVASPGAGPGSAGSGGASPVGAAS